MRKYDYTFLKSNISGQLMNLSNIITDLNGKEQIRKLQYVETFTILQNKAMIESVKGSNAIEGIVTSDDRIKDIIEGATPLSHDELEISGYKDALNLIHSSYQHINIDENSICMLHKMIEEQTNPNAAGIYKKTNNFIIEYNADGTRCIRFKPVDAKDTPESMNQLLLAFYDAMQDEDIPKILLIPCFILDFLCIHPFSDGNGRVSRLLSVLLLYQNNFDIVRYISFEGQVNKYKENYYNALQISSNAWHEGTNDYVPFIINFLQLLYRCYKDLDESFMEISLSKAKKSERVEHILLNAIAPLSKQDIVEKLPDVSIKTVELVINNMIKNNQIIKIGTYKNARYMKNNQ